MAADELTKSFVGKCLSDTVSDLDSLKMGDAINVNVLNIGKYRLKVLVETRLQRLYNIDRIINLLIT